jgi:hypothetical protein
MLRLLRSHSAYFREESRTAFRPGYERMRAMTAQPVDDYDPDDPVEIRRALPARFHEQFLAEYELAVAGARRPEQYRELHHVLRLWRLRAVAYSDPGYGTSLQDAQEAARASRRGTPIEEIVPDWDERVAAVQRRRAGLIRPRLRDALVPR